MNNISFNRGFASYGGAIIFNNDISNCLINNCDFFRNAAINDGGALYFKGITNVEIKNTMFSIITLTTMVEQFMFMDFLMEIYLKT